MDKRTKAYLAAILQVIIIGFSFLFVKVSLKKLEPLEILAFRFIFASITVILVCISKKNVEKLNKEAIISILPLSLLYPIMFFGFQAYGLVYATSSEGGMTHALTPIFTTVLSAIILKEKTKFKQNVMIVISILGLIFLTLVNSRVGTSFNLKGTIFLIISIISLALNTVFARKLTRKYSFKHITFVIILCGTVFFVVGAFIHYGLNFIYSFKKLSDLQTLFSILYLGVLASYGTSLLNNYALTTLEASKVAILSNITPIITIIVGVIIIK